jgi:DNA-binding transcriptional MocR family regulator
MTISYESIVMGTKWADTLTLDAGPKYKSLANGVRRAIESGTLTVGDKLPPVRDLAWKLNVTPGTVARAYSVLTDGGELEAVVGRGTFVAPRKRDVLDDVWSRNPAPPDPHELRLFSPVLPDMGQVAAIQAALASVATNDPEGLLNYPTRESYRPARQAVVDWLDDTDLGALTENEVVLSHGGQNAISLIMQAVVSGPRPVVLVEELSYAGFRRAAEMLRVEAVSVPLDEHGVIPEELDRLARRTGAQLFCTSAEVQNPVGLHTPLERRRALVDVCRRNDMPILEDDCYRIGPAKAPSYRALWPENGWYVGSISKTLTPALRIGYAIAPRERAYDLRRCAEYGFFGLARPLAEVATTILSDPRTRDLVLRIRIRLEKYVRAAVNILGGYDLNWQPDVPFVWLRLPAGWRAAAFCRAAQDKGIYIRSADEFALRDGRAPHAVRIAINARISLERFTEGMTVLRELLDHPPEQISV